MLRCGRAEDILENKISIVKPLLDVAATQLEVTAEIAPGGEILDQLAKYWLLRRPGIVDQWRVGLECFLFIEHCRQLFILDFDERQRLCRDLLVRRRDRRYRIANETHL